MVPLVNTIVTLRSVVISTLCLILATLRSVVEVCRPTYLHDLLQHLLKVLSGEISLFAVQYLNY